jgi:hypothetical protein
MKPIHLDGRSLSREQVVAVAYGATVELDEAQMTKVQRAADFLDEQVRLQEPIYGVSTGFGSNADKLLGAHRLRGNPEGGDVEHETLLDELQRNLVITHAVCVGEPFPAPVVRAHAGDSHQYPDAGPLRHPRAHAEGAGCAAQCRHRAGRAAPGLGGRQRRPGPAFAPGDRADGRR